MDVEIKPIDAGTLARFSGKLAAALKAQSDLNTYMMQRSARLAALKANFNDVLLEVEAEAKADARLQVVLAASGLSMWMP